MQSREMQKFTLIVSGCFVALLLAAAVLFSQYYDNRHEFQTSSSPATSESSDPCVRPTEQAQDELTPLEPEQEELLASDNALTTTELLGLHEELDQLDHPVPVTRQPASKTEALPAPQQPVPAKRADLRRRQFVRFHWNPVPGATAYQLKAWQMNGTQEQLLVDTQTSETEYRVEPKSNSKVYWTVAAIDADGNRGETAGPIAIEIMKPESESPRAPAEQTN